MAWAVPAPARRAVMPAAQATLRAPDGGAGKPHQAERTLAVADASAAASKAPGHQAKRLLPSPGADMYTLVKRPLSTLNRK
jgi:hypothetical protein